MLGMFYSGSPYLGQMETLPPGIEHAQPVRRVLHHLAQPCPLPVGCVRSGHVGSDHLPEG